MSRLLFDFFDSGLAATIAISQRKQSVTGNATLTFTATLSLNQKKEVASLSATYIAPGGATGSISINQRKQQVSGLAHIPVTIIVTIANTQISFTSYEQDTDTLSRIANAKRYIRNAEYSTESITTTPRDTIIRITDKAANYDLAARQGMTVTRQIVDNEVQTDDKIWLSG